jgi:hypothetical protein
MMSPGFQIITPDGNKIRFLYYTETTETASAFEKHLPFSREFMHARLSGFEIWIDTAPLLEIPQENASIFAEAGEVVIAPVKPQRNKIWGCMGIFYGEGRLLDAGNIFGKVHAEDFEKLKLLGDQTWRKGGQILHFEKI